MEPWPLGAHSPGGAQLSLINSQNHMCEVHATAGGVDRVLEGFPEEAALGLESAGG